MNTERAFYSGLWNTNSEIKKTRITCDPLESPRLFEIKKLTTEPGEFVSHKIEVDGVLLDQPFHDGGSVLVKGKKIVIHHISGETKFQGYWRVLDFPIANEEERTVVSEWTVDAKDSGQILLADFGKAQEFVLQIENSETQSIGNYKVIVDGKEFQWRSGGPVLYPLGSSVICRGQNVRIQIDATGSQAVKFKGITKILL